MTQKKLTQRDTQKRIITAQFQRNGISGCPFYAAIVRDAFREGGDDEFLVISLNDPKSTDGEGADPTLTFVIHMDDLRAGYLNDKWRGDEIPIPVLDAIRQRVEDDRNAR
jgi:hypothetical protein